MKIIYLILFFLCFSFPSFGKDDVRPADPDFFNVFDYCAHIGCEDYVLKKDNLDDLPKISNVIALRCSKNGFLGLFEPPPPLDIIIKNKNIFLFRIKEHSLALLFLKSEWKTKNIKIFANKRLNIVNYSLNRDTLILSPDKRKCKKIGVNELLNSKLNEIKKLKKNNKI